jgi:hypothetical protein
MRHGSEKKTWIQEKGSLGRENILTFYTKNYKKEMTRLATDQSKEVEGRAEANNMIPLH